MSAGSISAPSIIPLRVGQSSKFSIDTNTLIEIRSDTNDVDIYYTLDGSKPDAFITLTTRRSTIQYKKPFYIPRELANTGKVAIKAIAVSRNGVRESAVVTKVFDIKIVPSDHAQSDEYENKYLYELQQERTELIRRIQTEHEQSQQKFSALTHPYLQEKLPPYTHSNHIQKQTDVLRCAHCFAPKTTDSYTRFCTECGLPWQKLTHNPPETPSSIKVCANCNTTVPFNSNVCVVCETPTSVEQLPRKSIPNKSTILCPKCKSANPIHLRTCYICESILMPTPTPQIRASVSVPSAPTITGTMMTCSKCFRLNTPDARFCDWCGTNSEKLAMPLQCTKCRANNHPHAKFCSTCGCVIEPPLRIIDTRIKNDPSLPASSMIASTLARHSTNPTWINTNSTLNYYREPNLITKTEAATQTYGISYPSAKDLDLLLTQNKKLLDEQEFKEKRPILTSVSPGKGYWRQQLDHICAHLKAFAVNRPDFRALIGEPRMGKMVHATIHENEHQVTVQAVFRKPEDLSRTSYHVTDRSDHYSMNSERSSTYSSTFNSDDEYVREKPQRIKAKKRPKKRPQSAVVSESDSPTYDLIKLLEKKSSSGTKKTSHHHDVLDKVKQLIRDKKANGNARNKEGDTILQLAVRNGHYECLETLIKEGGAKLDKRGLGGNTALHECCLLGSNGTEPLRILLKYGGDATWANDKNQSVVDLASKKSTELMAVIASNRGQHMVDRHTKSHYNEH